MSPIIRLLKKQSSFTLLESLVVVAIFSVVMVSTAVLLMSLLTSWQKQNKTLELVENARWVMDFLVNEVRQAKESSIVVGSGGDTLNFQLPRGSTIHYVKSSSTLQRESVDIANNLSTSQAPFSWVSPILQITITVTKGNQTYSLVSYVRPRN